MDDDRLYPDGFKTPGYEFLSNFYPSPMTIPANPAIPEYLHGRPVPTLEHAYQAIACAERADARTMLAATSPGRAKRFSERIVRRVDWPQVRVDVMRALLRAKFADNPDLAEQLAATAPVPLVEWNSWGDVFWGLDVESLEGENRLGRLLEEVRDALLADRASAEATREPGGP